MVRVHALGNIAELWFITHAFDRMGLRINMSPSMPIGLWSIGTVRGPLARGMIISFCPLAAVHPAFAGSDYSPCPNGSSPFLKPIIALPGDHISIGDQGVAVKGRPIEGTGRIEDDQTPRIAVGDYRVHVDHVWVVSNHPPRSFDSWYFEPVKMSAILGMPKPVFAEGSQNGSIGIDRCGG